MQLTILPFVDSDLKDFVLLLVLVNMGQSKACISQFPLFNPSCQLFPPPPNHDRISYAGAQLDIQQGGGGGKILWA